MSVGALLASPTHAQNISPDRPALPAFSTAGQDGAASQWTNPANIGLDSDPSAMFIVNQPLQPAPGFNTHLGLAFNGGPLGTGFAFRNAPNGDAWWTLSSTLALPASDYFSLGARAAWHLPGEQYQNSVLWDIGATTRPTHWLGLSAIAYNVGNPSIELDLAQKYAAGVAVRPFDDRLMVGVDAVWNDGARDATPTLVATTTLEAKDGITLRASGDTTGTIGAGLELAFGRQGGGAFVHQQINAATTLNSPAAPPLGSAWVATTDRERRAFSVMPRTVGFVMDQSFPYQPTGGLFRALPGESYLSLLKRLTTAAHDPTVDGIVLELERISFSLAQIQELRAQLETAQANGKRVVAYLHQAGDNAAYALVVGADHVLMHPTGELDVVGLSAELRFFGNTLDLIGVDATYARRSEYKSGPEPLTRSSASKPAQEQINALLDDLHSEWLTAIADGRDKTVDEVQSLVDNAPYTASEALTNGLVDRLLYPDELEETLEEIFDAWGEPDTDYHTRPVTEGWKSRREIAVVYVTGTIVSGPSSTPGFFGGSFTAGSETIVQQLDQARKDESVKAVVLRVDSPGGSSFASEEIWRAVHQLQERGKPVVVSMGGTAASGGYYVSAGADAIYAEPTTVTGSIGVYAGPILDASDLLDRLGVDSEIYARGRNASMYSISKPMDPHEFAALDRMVASTYDLFKQRVADGRGLTDEEVENVARGRVWSGAAALKVGLVDELGGFDDAVARARQEAGVSDRADVRLVTFGNRVGPTGDVMKRGVRSALRHAGLRLNAPPPLPRELRALIEYSTLADERVMLLSPYDIEVQ